MTRFTVVLALVARFQIRAREDRALARFGQLASARQPSDRPPVPLFQARKPRLA